jgi:hypothetical protein
MEMAIFELKTKLEATSSAMSSNCFGKELKTMLNLLEQG